MRRDEPPVGSKFHVESENLGFPQNFDYRFIPSILLRDKVTKAYSLAVRERN